MTTPTPRHRGLRATAAAAMLAVALVTVLLAPAAAAIPIEGTGAPPEASGVETVEIVHTVTETVGVPYLAAVAIGLLAFAAAWLLASYVAGHRAHQPTVG